VENGEGTVRGPTLEIPGGLTKLTVEHNQACQPADVAIGAVSVFWAIQGANQQAATH
jgi:hypothetical protein